MYIFLSKTEISIFTIVDTIVDMWMCIYLFEREKSI